MIFNLEDANSAVTLYDAGDERSIASGGWAAFSPSRAGSAAVMYAGETEAQNRNNPVGCNKNAGSLTIYFKTPLSQASWANGAFGTVKNLDLSRFKKLHVRATAASSVGGTHYHVVGVTQSKTPPTDGTDTPPGTYTTLGAGETVLDISSLSGGYVYFGGMLHTAATDGTDTREVNIVVTRMWLT